MKEGLHSVLSIEDKPSTTAEKEDIYDRDDEVEEEEENAANFEEQEDEDIAPWLADIWSLVWPSGPSRDSPPISMLPTGYDDDLLNTISQTSQQVSRVCT